MNQMNADELFYTKKSVYDKLDENMIDNAYEYAKGYMAYLDAAKKVADYFIAHIPEDDLIPIDFRQPTEPHYEDSMAAAIAACGMIEIAKQSEGESGKVYRDVAIRMLRALEEKRCDWSEDVDHILLECAEGYHIPRKNMSIMYGDYYFIEAIWKLTSQEIFLW